MNLSKNRIVTIAIAIFLMFSMSASMMLIPSASAHTPAWNIPTFAYIEVNPNPIGVNQQVTVYMWLDKTYDPASALSNDYRFQNYELTITAPGGAKTTQTFAYISDPTSSQYTHYTPTVAGTYSFNFTFQGQKITTSNDSPTSALIGDTYLPSSASTTLTVQQSPIPAATGSSPLPTAYWTRPIYGENTNWYTISSNWLGSGSPGYSGFAFFGFTVTSDQQSFPGDAVGPTTSHVMWTKSLQSGGVVGGNTVAIAGDTYFEGSAYNNRFTNPIILDGMLYYTEPISFAGATSGPTVCVNLQTGQQIWSSTSIPALSFGYIYDVQDPNQHGVYPPILFASVGGFGPFGYIPVVWEAFDADTGYFMFNVTNIPTAAQNTALGPSGEYLIYNLVNDGSASKPQYYLGQWNSSRLWDDQYSGASTSPQVVPPITNGADPSLYDWNVSIPSLNTMTSPPTIIDTYYNNMIICYNGTYPGVTTSVFGTTSWAPYTYFAINLNATKGPIGSILWWNTVNPPAGNVTVLNGPADPTANGGTGVFTEAYKETMQFVGYSMSTGKYLWGPTTSQVSWDYYGSPYLPDVQGVAAYGKLYSSSFGGIVYCYDMANGDLLWTYGNGGAGNSTNAGFNTAYGTYPTFIYAIGDGVVYTITSEHTIETPIYKGALARAVNATTGAEIWALSDYDGGASAAAIADGFATFFNGYDNQIYVVGRGPSATTVQVPLTQITVGDHAIVQGTVMDISAGTKQTEQAADFPNGVPVSSDASMSAWMSYVYQQQPMPTNFTGVTVTLTAIDPNGNLITLGKATTDANGLFSYVWQTPDVPGKYTITATFAGTNGYWGSNAQTAVYVQSAPPATLAPTATPTSIANLYFLPVSIAIIIVIVIVGAVLALLMLRKRP